MTEEKNKEQHFSLIVFICLTFDWKKQFFELGLFAEKKYKTILEDEIKYCEFVYNY